MIFSEPRFLLFFAIAFAVHWMLPERRLRQAWLLLCSYVFYAAWDFAFLALILFSTAVDYAVGQALGRTRAPRARRRLLATSVAANLGVLAAFKYYGFFVESGAALLGYLGLAASPSVLSVGIPLGISFYTFQTLSYTMDVHAGRLEPERDPLRFALFVAFFPQLVAGPIVRARDFLPQLERPRVLAAVRVQACLLLFLLGFVKKACISDNVAPVVDAYFAAPGDYTAASAWLATLLYSVQIYCDFSGYSDMAIASAGLLGYNLCRNFEFPYLATSVAAFWRRWHISLSTWLRDYLYVPLGGSRRGRWLTLRNLMITMALGGLWHGAAWHFVLWGALHGAALVAHRGWRRLAGPDRGWVVGTVVGIALTYAWVCLTWIVFRATDLGSAHIALRSVLLWESPGSRTIDPAWALLFAALALAHAAIYRAGDLRVTDRLPSPVFAAAYGVAVALALGFVRPDVRPFIYFQF